MVFIYKETRLNYFTFNARKKIGAFFLIIKLIVNVVSNKIFKIKIFGGHEVLKLYFHVLEIQGVSYHNE